MRLCGLLSGIPRSPAPFGQLGKKPDHHLGCGHIQKMLASPMLFYAGTIVGVTSQGRGCEQGAHSSAHVPYTCH